MEVLSPRSANVPMKPRPAMKKPKAETKPKPEEKPVNPDRIDDKWRPPVTVTEPGSTPETYVTGRKLGKGGFAVCFEGVTKSKSEIFALKVVKAKVEQKKMMEKFRTELQIHAKMQHPNIVEFLRAFTSADYTYVVLELCPNGNLTDMVKARSCLSLPEVRRFMIQICGGVKYMHKRSVIHRDLKMGNIFLDSQMNLKIGDFGLAAVMADEQDRRTTLCGTPNYIAPEILSKSGSRGHDNKVDTWAVGVICYAMLMGTPPFQSKTQQEIYTKLKTLEYEWKIDSKNYIPQQAKDFVASCLNLVSAERPEMDTLVEHEFFTMGAIADILDSSCLKMKPIWLENADPRGDRVKAGYGITHNKICREAGVGVGPDGRSRPAAGGKVHISTLVEIEAENQEGSAPTIPLPEGILYNAFSEAQAEWSLRQKHPILPVKPRGRKPVGELIDAYGLERKVADLDLGARPAALAAAAVARLPTNSRGVPSFAAQQRQQALPSRTFPTQNISQSRAEPAAMLVDEPIPSTRGLLKARPVRAANSRVTRSISSQAVASASVASSTIPTSNTLPCLVENAQEAAAMKIIDGGQGPRISGTPSLRAASQSHSRMGVKNFGTKARDIAPCASSIPNRGEDGARRVLQPTTGNDRQPNPLKEENPQPLASLRRIDGLGSSSPVPSNCKSHIISAVEPYSQLKRTSAGDVLQALQKLHESISTGSTMETTPRPSSAGRRLRARIAYPRVDKWVDYATRHGIAYILTDGTLGMILKSSEDNSRPNSCVIVRNAKAHTIRRAQGLEDQFVPQGRDARDVEFYEQSNISADMKRLDIAARKFALDTKLHGTQMAASNAVQATLEGSELERMKEVALLDKFGKYMNKQIGDAGCEVDIEAGMEPSHHFIHFYQRLGNVGVWRFADGGLQFNFPDHTKLTVYQDRSSRAGEHLVDLVFLDPADAGELARHGVLTTEGLERRGLMTLSLTDVLTDSLRRSELEVVKSNEIKEKVSWIRAVVGCWIKEGGVGRMGEEKLGWSGLQERREDKRIKLQWVTVGRLGGDGDGVGGKC